MSDVQCAARVVVVADARGALGSLPGEHPAAVHGGPGTHEVAALLATELAVPLRHLPAEGPDGLENGLLALSDEYRGECVVVVVPEEVVADLRAQVLPAGSMAPGARVQVDDDGHRWAPWPSAAPE